MSLQPLIQTDCLTLTESQWRQGKVLPSGEHPLFILDEQGSPLGAVNRYGGLDPIGQTTLFQLDAVELDLSRFAFWVVLDSNGQIVGWFRSADLEQDYRAKINRHLALYRRILKALPCQIVVIDREGDILYANESFLSEHGIPPEKAVGTPLGQFCPEHSLLQLLKSPCYTQIMFSENGFLHVQSSMESKGVFSGALQLSFQGDSILQPAVFDQQNSANIETDIRAFYDSNWDVIYASDRNGITLDVSSACEELWGLKADELIGKSVYELEERGVYRPSITKMVLETGERVQAFQTTQTGHCLIVIGTPIKNSKGEITRIVNVSRDITDENQLRQELCDTKMLLEGYLHELEQLRSKDSQEHRFVYQSQAMQNVATLARKVSNVDATILICGESGVGKEVLATFIHNHSGRKDKPFIKINCSAIPPTLLESELFGYEKGAFTGAEKSGKPGIFELANTGTLFLDEIGEIPMEIQVKLLRVLQESEFMRVGGTKMIHVDIRVIAATNRNLSQEVQKGNFRKDLYYRLNVVPLTIPPLRDRPDDILPLTMFFLDQFNQKHQKRKTIASEVLEAFQNYPWEGNIRELQNMVERLVILSDQDVITVQDLPAAFRHGFENASIIINQIMPLKEAVSMVENQLIEMARKKYGTTKRIAQALGVDQSTISRKMNH